MRAEGPMKLLKALVLQASCMGPSLRKKRSAQDDSVCEAPAFPCRANTLSSPSARAEAFGARLR